MALKYEINADEILAAFSQFKDEAQKAMEESFEKMVFDAYADVVKQASTLSSATNKIYMEALQQPHDVTPHVWVIALDEKALWIEEGIEANKDMKPGLLKGAKYKVIPFRYDKKPSANTPMTQALVSEINQKLRKHDLSISKIEKDAAGSPKQGLLHEFDMSGKGRHVSWVKRRSDETHPLTRLRIYQNTDKQGNTRRDAMVFRTVTSGPASAGKFIHPGYAAKNFMDKAMDKAINEWENRVLPEIFAKWGNK